MYEIEQIRKWVEQGEVAFNPQVVKDCLAEVDKLRIENMQLMQKYLQLQKSLKEYTPEPIVSGAV